VTFRVREARPADIDAIIEVCEAAYPESWPWYPSQLANAMENFPAGMMVAVTDTDRVVGMAACLVIRWADYAVTARWGELTDHGHLGNHDPLNGDTLYGAEIMVDPEFQGQGVGTVIYAARLALLRSLGLRYIRAGARLAGLADYLAGHPGVTVPEYVERVVRGETRDPTVSFQLHRGFKVIGIAPRYFSDPESLGYAAVIEFEDSGKAQA
jgi:ribosomal protein S18 acetylase RimI-like enzyme